ncbi:MAG: GtrA family protein, partial [Ruminococcus sp.]|nr:GtrA family protein [Ruminococcus sp.]
FVTHKLWVFESKSWKGSILLKELGSFVGSRLLTGVLEWFGVPLLMLIGLDQPILGIEGMLAKILISVIVVILNYILSKLLVFKNKKK